MQKAIPRVFVKFAADGSLSFAEFLWHQPLSLLDDFTPSEIWETGGPLERAATQQDILRALIAARAQPSRMEVREPPAGLQIIREQQVRPIVYGTVRRHPNRSNRGYRGR